LKEVIVGDEDRHFGQDLAELYQAGLVQSMQVNVALRRCGAALKFV
jgi:hypothetical protein